MMLVSRGRVNGSKGMRAPSCRTLRMRVTLLLTVATLCTACATPIQTTGDSTVRAQLAPTGAMRIGLNLGNTLLVQKNATSGKPEGVAVQVARDLAARLGVPVTFVTFPSPAALADAAKDRLWDVAFLADDPARQALIAFSPAYVTIEATYIVLTDSRYRTADQVDSAGTRIAVPKGSAYDLYLSRSLREATLLQVESTPIALEKLRAGQAEAVAGLRAMLADRAAGEPVIRFAPVDALRLDARPVIRAHQPGARSSPMAQSATA